MSNVIGTWKINDDVTYYGLTGDVYHNSIEIACSGTFYGGAYTSDGSIVYGFQPLTRIMFHSVYDGTNGNDKYPYGRLFLYNDNCRSSDGRRTTSVLTKISKLDDYIQRVELQVCQPNTSTYVVNSYAAGNKHFTNARMFTINAVTETDSTNLKLFTTWLTENATQIERELKVVDAVVLDDGLRKIADVIRVKSNTTDKMEFPDGMVEAANTIETRADLKLQEKNVTVNGVVTPDDKYYGLSRVRVRVPTPDGYIKPEGTIELTTNGTHNVAEYAAAKVEVQIPAEYIIPKGTIELTTNGTHDVAAYAKAKVEGIITEVSTADEMSALVKGENVGKMYRFIGTTTDTYYTPGYLYEVVNAGTIKFRTYVYKLITPIVTIAQGRTLITITDVDSKTEYFYLYIDDVKSDTTIPRNGTDATFDLSTLRLPENSYRVQVVAHGRENKYQDSNKSNSVTVLL